MFSSLKKGLKVLYSTPFEPRVYGELVKRTNNRAFWEVTNSMGDSEIIHKGDIIAVL